MIEITRTPSMGTDGGMQVDINGRNRYYETLPSRTVILTVSIFTEHKALKSRLGEGYRSFIADIVCNPFR